MKEFFASEITRTMDAIKNMDAGTVDYETALYALEHLMNMRRRLEDSSLEQGCNTVEFKAEIIDGDTEPEVKVAPYFEKDDEPEVTAEEVIKKEDMRAMLARAKADKGIDINSIITDMGYAGFTAVPASMYPELKRRVEEAKGSK